MHGAAPASHACHRRIEVPAHPSWGPLTQRSVSTCTRPRGTAPSTTVRRAPLSLGSSVETVLEGKEKSLLEACFNSVLWLPPEKEMTSLDASLYFSVSAD